MPPTGRPSKRTPELEAEILERIEQGETVSGICRSLDIDRCQLTRWLQQDESFRTRYAQSMEARWEQSGDQIIDILNEPIPDDIPVKGWNAWVNWQKNRADGLKWVAERAYPKKYGKRMDLTTEGQAIAFIHPAPNVDGEKL